MAERWIAVDSGKFSSKIVEYKPNAKVIRKCSMRSKVSEGDFEDDAIEKETVIVEIDGKVYKVGNGARGEGVTLENNKKTEDHRICVLTALASFASSNEVDDINVAIGLPAIEWENVQKRNAFKNYMLPEGEVAIKIKKDSASDIVEKKFRIKKRYVFPESIGALCTDEIMGSYNPTRIMGVLDIGNLHLNATLWQGDDLVHDKIVTANLGGAVLIQQLAQEITSNIVQCDELTAATIIKSKDKSIPNKSKLTEEQITLSKEIIDRTLARHARSVLQQVRSKNWSLDLIEIVAIGGTSADIKKELEAEFKGITVLPDSQFWNAFGYLRLMCSKKECLKELIPLTEESKVIDKVNKAEKKAS